LHAGDLAERLHDLGQFAELPMSLSEARDSESALPRLAEEAGDAVGG